jgi:hypothetical protein
LGIEALASTSFGAVGDREQLAGAHAAFFATAVAPGCAGPVGRLRLRPTRNRGRGGFANQQHMTQLMRHRLGATPARHRAEFIEVEKLAAA